MPLAKLTDVDENGNEYVCENITLIKHPDPEGKEIRLIDEEGNMVFLIVLDDNLSLINFTDYAKSMNFAMTIKNIERDAK
jgi:hypothetical protein